MIVQNVVQNCVSKRYCKQCDGCEHGRVKKHCKECTPNLQCEHNRIKYNCKDCNTSNYCEHNRERRVCKECKCVDICEHNRIKYQCKECGGKKFCKHNIRKAYCKECGGSELCQPHGIRKDSCRECNIGNKVICEHGQRSRTCRDCKTGTSICVHETRKSRCGFCEGCGSELCKSCRMVLKLKYHENCYKCYIHDALKNKTSEEIKEFISKLPQRERTKEIRIYDTVTHIFPNYDWKYNMYVPVCGENGKRETCYYPDIHVNMGSYILLIEIDENQHSGYNSCETRRMTDMLAAFAVPLYIVRFNPDTYTTSDNVSHKSMFTTTISGVKHVYEQRLKLFLKRIQKLLALEESKLKQHLLTIEYINYSYNSQHVEQSKEHVNNIVYTYL